MKIIMNWIDKNLKNIIKIIFIQICITLLINKFTLSFFDQNPPLSQLAIYLMFFIYFISFISSIFFFYYRTLFFQLIVAFICLISIELVLSLFVERENPNLDKHKEFRLQQPQPYVNAEYFSRDFINESFTQPGGWLLDKKYGGVKPRNFEGKWINVRNNRRVTLNKPGIYSHKIYLFGGSTVYNGEVPDKLTIASQLASIGANNFQYEVVNMGATSIHSTQQFGRLKAEIKLKEGDVVIFYDGVNDVYQRIININREGYMYGQPKQEKFWVKILRNYSKDSSILHFLFSKVINNTYYITPALIESSSEDYIKTLVATNEYVLSQKAYFYHFLQPTLFTRKNLNEYENILLKKGHPIVSKQVIKAFTEAYPIILNKLYDVNFSYSLTEVFDELLESPYLDFCHVTHIGNKIIATNIWNNIRDELKL